MISLRPGTSDCPAAGTRADGRRHNGPGRTRQWWVRGREFRRPAARASADRASEPPGREPPCPPLVPCGDVAGGRGPGWTDDPGQTRQQVQGRGSHRPDAWASADMASEPSVKGQCLLLIPGGAVAGGRGPGWTDGPGRTGPRAQGRGSCRPGVWQRYV